MAYRNEHVSMGLPGISEFQIWRTQASAIRQAAQALWEEIG
jgi:copper homeostasis protein